LATKSLTFLHKNTALYMIYKIETGYANIRGSRLLQFYFYRRWFRVT